MKKKRKEKKQDFEKPLGFLQKWFAPLKNKKPRTDNKFFGFLQQLGGTFMLPVAVLTIAGVLLGIGSGLQSVVTKEVSKGGYEFLGFILLSGSFFFSLLPLAFTVAIPVGLCTKHGGAAAFAAVVAYFGHLAGMNYMISILPENVYNSIFNSAGISAEKMKLIKPMFGFEQIMDMSILGAIFNGIIIWKFHDFIVEKKFITAFAFIGGKRFTSILAILIFPIIGVFYTFTWPWFAKGLFYVGDGLSHLGIAGPGLFIFISRMLCPTGLHHMFNALLQRTAVGGVYEIDGQIYEGFGNAGLGYLQDGQQVPPDIAMWLTGAYILPILFGLPAAAVAMYMVVKKENRPMIKAAIISGIIATIFGGITETIEFLFLFIAPLLYVFHAIMVGIGYVIFALLGSQVYQGGDIFVWLIFGPFQAIGGDNKWWLGLAFGPIWASIYFSVFYFAIKKFDIKTLGRGENLENSALNSIMGVENSPTPQKNKNKITTEVKIAENFLKLVGGWENIEHLTNCFTRLRVTLKTPIDITDQETKNIGCIGLKTISNTSYQFIIGAQVEIVRNILEEKKNEHLLKPGL